MKTWTIEAKDKRGIVWSFMSGDLQGAKIGDNYTIKTPIRLLKDLTIINIEENPIFCDVTA